jgi:NADPH:quinone reductase-like Zn-dependent oxidoreductase
MLAIWGGAQVIADIGHWARDGKAQFAIAARFSLDQVVAAHQAVERGEKGGHVLLTPL